ncbi:hypothetical protein E3N88_07960 [Mikania micrantha]|uniref:ABC transporter domain-containing protein n=1 Tax=Mikania micrantha TaxID=192012 RepID=A0A5N6PHZ9_9ASTR|nr:hypothetical protein E3N88_07960 [Mikania micrantha]
MATQQPVSALVGPLTSLKVGILPISTTTSDQVDPTLTPGLVETAVPIQPNSAASPMMIEKEGTSLQHGNTIEGSSVDATDPPHSAAIKVAQCKKKSIVAEVPTISGEAEASNPTNRDGEVANLNKDGNKDDFTTVGKNNKVKKASLAVHTPSPRAVNGDKGKAKVGAAGGACVGVASVQVVNKFGPLEEAMDMDQASAGANKTGMCTINKDQVIDVDQVLPTTTKRGPATSIDKDKQKASILGFIKITHAVPDDDAFLEDYLLEENMLDRMDQAIYVSHSVPESKKKAILNALTSKAKDVKAIDMSYCSVGEWIYFVEQARSLKINMDYAVEDVEEEVNYLGCIKGGLGCLSFVFSGLDVSPPWAACWKDWCKGLIGWLCSPKFNWVGVAVAVRALFIASGLYYCCWFGGLKGWYYGLGWGCNWFSKWAIYYSDISRLLGFMVGVGFCKVQDWRGWDMVRMLLFGPNMACCGLCLICCGPWLDWWGYFLAWFGLYMSWCSPCLALRGLNFPGWCLLFPLAWSWCAWCGLGWLGSDPCLALGSPLIAGYGAWCFRVVAPLGWKVIGLGPLMGLDMGLFLANYSWVFDRGEKQTCRSKSMNTTVLAFNPWRSRALGVGYVRLDINQRCVNSEASFFKSQASETWNELELEVVTLATDGTTCGLTMARNIKYRPPGTEINLLNDINFTLPEKRYQFVLFAQHLYFLWHGDINNQRPFTVPYSGFAVTKSLRTLPWQQIQKLFLSGFLSPLLISSYALTIPACYSFGLIFGRSGSGKTTLLQLIAGLTKPTSGSIYIQRYSDDDSPTQPPVLLSPERVGIVFQFPERYFVADNVFDEITFGLPRQKSNLKAKEHIARRIERAIASVGLNGISLDKNPNSLSGGFKRRLALAIQLVQRPEVLVLDEPLAGLELPFIHNLDWKARVDVVKLLKNLKKELTILAVLGNLLIKWPLSYPIAARYFFPGLWTIFTDWFGSWTFPRGCYRGDFYFGQIDLLFWFRMYRQTAYSEGQLMGFGSDYACIMINGKGEQSSGYWGINSKCFGILQSPANGVDLWSKGTDGLAVQHGSGVGWPEQPERIGVWAKLPEWPAGPVQPGRLALMAGADKGWIPCSPFEVSVVRAGKGTKCISICSGAPRIVHYRDIMAHIWAGDWQSGGHGVLFSWVD